MQGQIDGQSPSRVQEKDRLVKAETATEIYTYDADSGLSTLILDGLNDIWQTIKMTPIWTILAWLDFLQETRRTALGPLWSIVGTGVTVAVLGYVYGAVLGMTGSTVFPYIAAGLIIWFFISGCVQGGLSVYISARGILEERSLPVAFSAFRFVLRYLMEFFVKSAVSVIFALIVALPMTMNVFWVLPGLIILALNGLWVVLVFGPLGARYRDVSQIVSPFMLIAFLASPVFWKEGMLGGSSFIALYNPFAHFLAIVRDPLLGSPAPMISVVVTLTVTVFGLLLATLTHCLTKNRIVFWI